MELFDGILLPLKNERIAPLKHKIVEMINTIINPIVKSAFVSGSVMNVGFDKISFNSITGIKKVKIALNNAILVDCPTTRMVERIPAAIP